jgi:hypothetical protein
MVMMTGVSIGLINTDAQWGRESLTGFTMPALARSPGAIVRKYFTE